MEIEAALGADIIMAFDECVPYPSTARIPRIRCASPTMGKALQGVPAREDQALFGIVQGGVFEDLGRKSAKAIADMDFIGNGIGGLSVGEPKQGHVRNA
jgi:queuine tRNA-ribosyltransferase